MPMHVLAHGGLYGHHDSICTESWLREKNPLPYWRLEPASVLHLAFQSDSLPIEISPSPSGPNTTAASSLGSFWPQTHLLLVSHPKNPSFPFDQLGNKHKRLKRMLILIGQYKTCTNICAKPYFKATKWQLNDDKWQHYSYPVMVCEKPGCVTWWMLACTICTCFVLLL